MKKSGFSVERKFKETEETSVLLAKSKAILYGSFQDDNGKVVIVMTDGADFVTIDDGEIYQVSELPKGVKADHLTSSIQAEGFVHALDVMQYRAKIYQMSQEIERLNRGKQRSNLYKPKK